MKHRRRSTPARTVMATSMLCTTGSDFSIFIASFAGVPGLSTSTRPVVISMLVIPGLLRVSQTGPAVTY